MAAGAFHPHIASIYRRVTGKALCASVWFWIMYHAKQDEPVILGLCHPWDHGHHDEKL